MDADASFDFWDECPTRRVEVLESGGEGCVLVDGRMYMRWEQGDEESRRMAMVQLHASEQATREEVAAAFGVHVNTLQGYITHYAQDGFSGLVSRQRGPQGGWKLTARRRGKIVTTAIREGVDSVDALQRRLSEQWGEEISRRSIRRVLEENGLLDVERLAADSRIEQSELFAFEADRQLDLGLDAEADGWFADCDLPGGKHASAPNGVMGVDSVARERRRYSSAQRAYFDRLEQGDYNTYAGGLLFAPLVQRYEFLSTLQRVIEIPAHGGYSLDELCLTLLYADVFGFRSMEDFKRAYPEEFGMLIGRSHSPSVFTLRRFLHAVRELDKSEALIDEFAVSYLRHGQAQWGVMYIDGHFLPYYGVYPITKGWHGVRQIAMKGSYNFLAVDERFRPWLFLVRSSSEDLLEKIPELIEKAKKLGRAAGLSEERTEDLIVLFDREGYSAELYRYLEGKDQGPKQRRAIFITWAKYAGKWVYDIAEESLDKTVTVTYEIREPEPIRYVELNRKMNKYGKIRAIVIQSGKQRKRAAIYTNAGADELDAERVVQLMCRRWGEENQIKELLLKHMINYMPGYVIEDMEEQPWVENPKIRELKKKRTGLQGDLRGFKVQLAEDMLKRTDRQVRAITAKEFPVMEHIVRTESEILLLNTQLDELPRHVRFDEAHDGQKLMALNYEKKRFLDCIKVFSANLTDAMCRMLLRYYDRRKDILPALSMIVDRAGEVRLEEGQLRVRLRRFRNPEIDYAARRLCEDLNRMAPTTLDRFRMPMHFEVA
jgi:transposase